MGLADIFKATMRDWKEEARRRTYAKLAFGLGIIAPPELNEAQADKLRWMCLWYGTPVAEAVAFVKFAWARAERLSPFTTQSPEDMFDAYVRAEMACHESAAIKAADLPTLKS